MAFFRRPVTDAEIDEELRTHLKLAIEDRIGRGQNPEEARRAALLQFGNLRATKEDVRSIWTWTAVEQLFADARSGLQVLTRSPGISLTAITLIALVIGGNTTIFSIVHGLLTKPAPAITARNLVSLGWAVDRQAVHPVDSYANYVDVAAAAQTIRPLLAFQYERFTLTYRDGSYAMRGDLVSPNYFDTLGLVLVRGRVFTEDEARGSALTAVISHRVWTDHFQQRDDVVGQRIVLNGQPATVVGVAPLRFQGAWAEHADVWVPIAAYAHVRGAARGLDDRTWGAMAMLGRLAENASMNEARSELATIAARLEAAYPATNKGKSIVPYPYSVTAAGDSILAQRGLQFLAIFQIITALTLFIVCANVANLMLARAVARQREMAVRQSFGASRMRVVRLVLAEGIAISAGAWAVACLFAWALGRVIAALLPPAGDGASLAVDFTPDWTVIAYAMALAAVGTIAFTIGPAIRTWHQDVLPFLKAGEQGVVQGRSRLASGLVVMQLAFAVLLLASAGLAYRSLSLVNALDLGFNSSGMLLVTVTTDGVPEGVRGTLIDRMRERLASIPAVTTASYAGSAPKEFWSTTPVRVTGAQQPLAAERTTIGPDYLRVLGLTPRLGRELTTEDRTRTTTAAVINENLAQALWPGKTAVGRTLLVGPERQPVDVVGIAPNAFFSGFRPQDRPYFIFLPKRLDQSTGDTTFYVRYSGPIDPVGPAVGRALADVDSRAPIVYMRTMDTQLSSITSVIRVMTTMLSLFAAASLLIATLGQYAVLAFTMKRRTRDFGVRMALGASAAQILSSVLREGLRLTTAGLLIGSALSLVSGRALRSMLFGVTPTDPLTYAGVVITLACASLMACWLPGWRASRIDPMTALREE